MAEPTPPAQAVSADRSSPWLHRLARVRQWVAVAFLAAGVVSVADAQIHLLRDAPAYHQHDPALFLYAAGALGLALRAFWARYLAICVAAAITTIQVVSGWRVSSSSLLMLAFILLLSGRSMRGLFEGRAGARNRWAADLDRRIARLRVLFVAQSMVLGLVWAAAPDVSPIGRPLTLVAGLALAGLVFQRTWGALLLVPVLAAEIYLAAAAVRVGWGFAPEGCLPALLVALSGLSAVLLAPLLRAFAERVRAR
jgi:hypothetical protein